MSADTFWNRLRSGKPPAYEVLADGEIQEPLGFNQIKRAVQVGQFSLHDSYRRKGTTEWKSVEAALKGDRLSETLINGFSALFTLALGIVSLWLFFKVNAIERESLSWPSVPGVITVSEVSSPSGDRYEYMPHVGYTYRVGSKKYFGETIYPTCLIGGTKSWAQSIIARYPIGSRGDVYYRPSKPGLAVLERGLAPHSFAPGGIGFMFIFTSVLFGCLARSVWRKPLDQAPSPEIGRRILFFILTVFVGFVFFWRLP